MTYQLLKCYDGDAGGVFCDILLPDGTTTTIEGEDNLSTKIDDNLSYDLALINTGMEYIIIYSDTTDKAYLIRKGQKFRRQTRYIVKMGGNEYHGSI